MTVVSGGTSVMGSRRRAAAIASPSRVWAFSRLRSSSELSLEVVVVGDGRGWRGHGFLFPAVWT